MRVSPYQGDFSAGEISPTVYGRVDSDRYKAALATCLNAIPLTSGQVMRRSGTRFLTEMKQSDAAIIPFIFSRTQNYFLEIGRTYMRVHTADGPVLNSVTGLPYEVAYSFPALFGEDFIAYVNNLAYRQKNDVLYLVSEYHFPLKILRYAHDEWVIRPMEMRDGPFEDSYVFPKAHYMQINGWYNLLDDWTHDVSIPAMTIAAIHANPVAAGFRAYDLSFNYDFKAGDIVTFNNTGSVSLDGQEVEIAYMIGNKTIVVPDATPAPLNMALSPQPGVYASVFHETSTGRKFRALIEGVWDWGEVVRPPSGYAGGRVAYIRLQDKHVTGTMPKVVYNIRFGAIDAPNAGYPYNGYPTTIAFHEDRLILGGLPGKPGLVMTSRTGDYENFSPTDPDGSVPSDSGMTFTIPETNAMQWMESDEKGLLIGTSEAEHYTRGATYYEALSPTNIVSRKSTSYGSGPQGSVMASKATLFVRGSGKKISDIMFYYDVDGFRVTDLSVLADHICKVGIVSLDFQKEPTPILWVLLKDGTFGALTYDRDLDGLRAGWHRHEIAGGSVKSVAVIPEPDGGKSIVGMVVHRTIGTVVKCSLEIIQPDFEDTTPIEDAWFVDGGLQYYKEKEFLSVERGVNPLAAILNHGLTTGTEIEIASLEHFPAANGQRYSIAVVNANAFNIIGLDTSTMPVTPFFLPGAPTSSTYGSMLVLASTFSGLGHLEGKTVQILAEGHVLPEQVVTAGVLTLNKKYRRVTVGLKFNTDIKTLRLEAGAQDGTSIGKKRRMNSVNLMLKNTSALKMGMSFDELDELVFRKAEDDISLPTPLFTGLTEEILTSGHDTENQICIRQDQPLPFFLLAIAPQMTTYDKG